MDFIQINDDGSNCDVRKRPPSPISLKTNQLIPNIMKYWKTQKINRFYWQGNDHKIRTVIVSYSNTDYIEAIAHLKRFLGSPSHWKFEFRYQGQKGKLTLEQFTNVKIAEKISFNRPLGFNYVRGWEKEATRIIEKNIEVLWGMLFEKNHEVIRYDMNPYYNEYLKVSNRYNKKYTKVGKIRVRLNDD